MSSTSRLRLFEESSLSTFKFGRMFSIIAIPLSVLAEISAPLELSEVAATGFSKLRVGALVGDNLLGAVET